MVEDNINVAEDTVNIADEYFASIDCDVNMDEIFDLLDSITTPPMSPPPMSPPPMSPEFISSLTEIQIHTEEPTTLQCANANGELSNPTLEASPTSSASMIADAHVEIPERYRPISVQDLDELMGVGSGSLRGCNQASQTILNASTTMVASVTDGIFYPGQPAQSLSMNYPDHHEMNVQPQAIHVDLPMNHGIGTVGAGVEVPIQNSQFMTPYRPFTLARPQYSYPSMSAPMAMNHLSTHYRSQKFSANSEYSMTQPRQSQLLNHLTGQAQIAHGPSIHQSRSSTLHGPSPLFRPERYSNRQFQPREVLKMPDATGSLQSRPQNLGDGEQVREGTTAASILNAQLARKRILINGFNSPLRSPKMDEILRTVTGSSSLSLNNSSQYSEGVVDQNQGSPVRRFNFEGGEPLSSRSSTVEEIICRTTTTNSGTSRNNNFYQTKTVIDHNQDSSLKRFNCEGGESSSSRLPQVDGILRRTAVINSTPRSKNYQRTEGLVAYGRDHPLKRFNFKEGKPSYSMSPRVEEILRTGGGTRRKNNSQQNQIMTGDQNGDGPPKIFNFEGRESSSSSKRLKRDAIVEETLAGTSTATMQSTPRREVHISIYDPVHERVGLPIDPHLRLFKFNPKFQRQQKKTTENKSK